MKSQNVLVWLVGGYFLAAGLTVLPYPGIQNDEALFATAIYAPAETCHTVQVFGRKLSLMLMPYLGSLKGWVYTPVFKLWPPSAYSVRVPVLVLGLATILFTYKWLAKSAGRAVAVAAAVLLATDATYLYTTVFDWGPVALQRLLMVSGVLALWKFKEQGRRYWLGLGFFLFGLAFWDKALFVWCFAGMAVGWATILRTRIFNYLNLKNCAVAAVALALGAFPLLRYNIRSGGGTLRSTQGWSTDRQMIRNKLTVLERSLDGTGLLGYLSFEDPASNTRGPSNGVEKFAVAVEKLAGQRRQSLMWYAVLGALLSLPWIWHQPERHWATFAAVVMGVAWTLMLFGGGVGASVHHVGLMWPWPQVLVAASLAGLARRAGRAGTVAMAIVLYLLCARNVVASSVQFAQMVRNGSPAVWSDAITKLAQQFQPGRDKVIVLDWGMSENLRLLHRGKLSLLWGGDPIREEPLTDEKLREFRWYLEQEGAVFVSHTDASEVFVGINQRRDEALRRLGWRRLDVRAVTDSHGRPVFEVFRAVPEG